MVGYVRSIIPNLQLDWSHFCFRIVCVLFVVWAAPPSCHYQDFVCSDTCLSVYFCVGADEKPIFLMNCTGTSLCNSISGNCTEDEGLSCFAEHPFACKAAGFFPDLYDCSTFYNCTGSAAPFTKERFECVHSAYDVTTKRCDLPTTSPVCERNGRIPGCTRVGDSGVVDGDSTLYYLCMRDPVYLYIYPELHRCSEGGTYDPNTYTCS